MNIPLEGNEINFLKQRQILYKRLISALKPMRLRIDPVYRQKDNVKRKISFVTQLPIKYIKLCS